MNTSAGAGQKEMVVDRLADRFMHGKHEKNDTLIRYDIIVGLKKLYDETKDEEIKQTALQLIENEEDAKYKKKYASVWKKA